jgi:hypothetical protein
MRTRSTGFQKLPLDGDQEDDNLYRFTAHDVLILFPSLPEPWRVTQISK